MSRLVLRTLALCIGLTSLPLAAGDVARVGSDAITEQELERAASVRLLRVRTEMYEARRAAVDELATTMLVARAAAAAKLSPEAWLDREIAKRMVDVTAAEIAQAHASATGGIEKADLARSMREVRRDETRKEIVRELRAAAKIDVRLEPPRLDERDLGGALVHGSDDAPVTIVVFEDFECPFSARLAPVVVSLRESYPESVRILHRDLPLAKHPHAKQAAEAAACAAEEGRYWELSALLYENQKSLDRESLEKYALEAGLDRDQFVICLDSGRQSHSWIEGLAAARKYAVRGTPALFINGRLLAGARDLEDIAAVIDEELRAALPAPPAPSPARTQR